MKNKLSSYLFLFSIASVIVALDQWTKWLVRTNIPFAQSWLPKGMDWLMPYARIVHWQNSGAAFGIFQNGSIVFGVLAVIVICVILYFYPQVAPQDWGMRIAMAMQFAGAAGNLIDRLMFSGKVTDFISVGTFAVFNVADSSITLGVGVLLLDVWLKERQEKKNKALAESEASNGSGPTSSDVSTPEVSKPS